MDIILIELITANADVYTEAFNDVSQGRKTPEAAFAYLKEKFGHIMTHPEAIAAKLDAVYDSKKEIIK